MIFFNGLFLGFLIAAPVGPIGVLCIQRTLTKGKLSGFVSGLGAATADGFYGTVAAFGLVAISGFLIEQQFLLRLIGGVFLLYIGVKSFRSAPPTTEIAETSKRNLLQDYVTTVFLTITNPMTIISFAALFAGVGFGFSNSGFLSAISLVSGVFLGSALWWLVLSVGVTWLRSRIKNFSFSLVNKISGVVIVLFALYILGSVLR